MSRVRKVSRVPKGDDGEPGPKGDQGEPGVGVPAGGSTGQILAKASGSNYDTVWVDNEGGGGGSSNFVGFCMHIPTTQVLSTGSSQNLGGFTKLFDTGRNGDNSSPFLCDTTGAIYPPEGKRLYIQVHLCLRVNDAAALTYVQLRRRPAPSGSDVNFIQALYSLASNTIVCAVIPFILPAHNSAQTLAYQLAIHAAAGTSVQVFGNGANERQSWIEGFVID